MVLLSRAWCGQGLSLLSRDFFCQECETLSFVKNSGVFLLGHLLKPKPLDLQVQEHMVLCIDLAAKPCALDTMHHRSTQGADSTHKIFSPEVPTAPWVYFFAVHDQVTTGMGLHGDVEQLPVLCFCPLIEPGVAGKKNTAKLPGFVVCPFVKEHPTVIKQVNQVHHG